MTTMIPYGIKFILEKDIESVICVLKTIALAPH